MKLGIVGSRKFKNTQFVREFVHKLDEKYGDDLVIVSGGQSKGVDRMAKKAAIGMGVNYVEFPPAHYDWNEHCYHSEDYFSKSFEVRYYHERNRDIVKFSNFIFALLPKGMKLYQSKGTHSTIKSARDLGTKHKVINA